VQQADIAGSLVLRVLWHCIPQARADVPVRSLVVN
jgi:hypothetical protein